MFLPLSLLLLIAAGSPQAPASLHFVNGDARVPLEVDGSRFGFRFDAALDADAVRGLIASLPGLDAASAEEALLSWRPGRTLVVAAVTPLDAASALERAAVWRTLPGVASASPRLWAPGPDPMYLTEEILVRWKPDAPASVRAAWTADLTHGGTLAYSTNPGEVWRVAPGTDPLELANRIAASGWTEFALPDFQLLRVTYAGANDPLYPDQWHLESIGQNGALPDADVDVEGAWSITRGDPQLVVAVVDEGVELTHPDLALVQGRDVLDDDNDPQAEDFLFGLLQENHGTAVSGVAAARGDNGLGVSGVAQDCRVMPIRFLSANLLNQPTVQDEAEAFNFARQNGAAVVNNSWGPSAAAVLPASTKAAIDDCNRNGRGGLGMVVFFAAGNSGADNALNGYASYDGVVGVSACNDQGVLSSYSSFGRSVDVCAPSNGGVNGITTTDRLGAKGYSAGDYTDTFGGTSSASPCAAGVMLLILSANPALTRAEAIGILLGTAQKIDPAGGAYDAFGHSIRYGYGRVNAEAAVTAALAGGLPRDQIALSAPGTAAAGAPLQLQFQSAPASAPYGVLASLGNSGSVMFGHTFDVGPQLVVVATGVTNGAGSGAKTVATPGAFAGRTVWFEIGALGAGGIVDSNAAAVALQ